MTWPAEQDDASLLTTTLIGTTLELPSSTPELVEALRHDREVLVREALLWQRWIRYSALFAFSALALVLGEGSRGPMMIPVGLVALAYVLTVGLTAEFIQRAEMVHERRLPALLVTADVAALTAIIYLSGTPAEMGRILMASTLVVQLAVFYFGRWLGTYAAFLTCVAYIVTTRVVPSSGVMPDQSLAHVLYSLGVFCLVCAVFITAYGSFRVRMNRLRLFCKLVEEGDLTPSFALGADKRPDDLTLLGRSFEAMRSRLAEQIGTDPLTACLNRRALETRLRAEWRQAKRRSSTVAVLAIDLDHFKQINDTRGHPVGDIVLQELAGIMKATARDTDAVARLGGDEFVIVLPDTGWQGALTFAERLRRKVDDYDFAAEGVNAPIRNTISVGVALARGTDPISPEMLLQEADRSLYKAKSAGRNRVFA
ncbi:MAG: GGDEF domain-containing protein [Gemmatimonadaceae bacterium]